MNEPMPNEPENLNEPKSSSGSEGPNESMPNEAKNSEALPDPVPLEVVRQLILNYHIKYNRIADVLDGIAPGNPDLRIDREKEHLHFYIDKASLQHILKISELEGCEAVSAFFALKNNSNQLAVCFIGVDKDGQILDAHFTGEPVDNRLGPPYDASNPNHTQIPTNAALKLATHIEKVQEYFTRSLSPVINEQNGA